MFRKSVDQNGAVVLYAMLILFILTTLGLSISRVTSDEVRIMVNETHYKERFYVAEGGMNREAQEICLGTYPVFEDKGQVLGFSGYEVDGTAREEVHHMNGTEYDYTVRYVSLHNPVPLKGFGIDFSASSFEVTARDHGNSVVKGDPPKEYWVKGVQVRSQYYKLRPENN